MPFNGTGTFVRVYNWTQDKLNGIKIRADRMDTETDGIATGLSNCVTRNGQSPPTANLPMAGFRFTGVGAASDATDFLRADQAQTNAMVYFTASGTDDYTITPSPTPASLDPGLGFWVLFTNANTGACTLTVGALTQTALEKNVSTPLISGDIPAGMIAFCQYDGTRFQIQRTFSNISAFMQTLLNAADAGTALSTLTALGQGSWEMYIPAAAMWPPTTNGANYGQTVEVAATQPTIFALAFDPSTKEYAQFSIRWPKSLGTATFTFTPVWSHPSTTTNFGVVFSCAAVAFSNDDSLATAFGTAQTSTDTGGTTNDIYVGPTSSAITAGNTPAANDYYYFQIAREVSDGSDTMAVDAYLHGVVLTVTVSAVNDA